MLTVVFGGAFDPPHLEHAMLCASAVRELSADRLVLVPTYLPPHKCEGFLSYADRAELARCAFSRCAPEVIVDDIEQQRMKDNYTSDVLPILKRKYGEIAYLLGGDGLEYFDTWHEPAEILSICPMVSADRAGFTPASESAERLKSKYGVGEFKILSFKGGAVSSSVLKAKLLLSLETPEIDDGVKTYIREHGLFREYDDIIKKLKTYEDEELFDHTQSVVLRAMKLNSLHNLKQDFKKTFLAALLHDNAKRRPSVDGLDVPQDAVGTSVLHQFLGAEKAKRDFGITDEEILSAIRYHTTAKSGMTTFEKLIYTADSTSYDRKYEPIPQLRAVADENFERGFEAVLSYTYHKLHDVGKPIYPLTLDAVKYYLSE